MGAGTLPRWSEQVSRPVSRPKNTVTSHTDDRDTVGPGEGTPQAVGAKAAKGVRQRVSAPLPVSCLASTVGLVVGQATG